MELQRLIAFDDDGLKADNSGQMVNLIPTLTFAYDKFD